MNTIIKELKRSLSIIKENPFSIVYQVMFDILFMFSYGALVLPMLNNIADQLSAISVTMSSEVSTAGREYALPTIGSILQNPEVAQYLKNIFWLYVLAGAGFYVVYCFFQGINWKIAEKAVGQKMPFYKFMTRFFLVNIIWMIAYIIHHFMGIYSDVQLSMLERIGAAGGMTSMAFIALLFWAVLFYFAVISYCLLENRPLKAIKKSFSIGIRKAVEIIPMFAVIGLAVIIVDLFLRLFTGRILIIFGVLTFLPVIAWARIFANISVKRA